MNRSKPRASVMIPNYNYARLLRKRLRTVLDHTYGQFEIVYLDDCSTDNSHERLSSGTHAAAPHSLIVRNRLHA